MKRQFKPSFESRYLTMIEAIVTGLQAIFFLTAIAGLLTIIERLN